MNTLIQWMGQPMVHRLGLTLFHFLWQGAVIAGLFAVGQAVLPRRACNARYLTGCFALMLMLAAPVATFFVLGAKQAVPTALTVDGTAMAANPAPPPVLSETEAGLGVTAAGRQTRSGERFGAPMSSNGDGHRPPLQDRPLVLHSDKFIRVFVFAWLLGVCALSLRLLFASMQVARLKRRGNEPLGAPWITQLQRLKAALQISRPVLLVKSALVQVPTVVGWLRPVIFLPAASLTGLTPSQLESILAHELAHVRRHDYLVNLLQNALETLLFYHPAVWWVSSYVRAEREICCDEIAVQLCGDRLAYAHALTTLEELRGGTSLALGADGGSLLERIRRLSGAPGGVTLPGRRRAGGLLVAALVGMIFVSLLHHPSSNAKAQTAPPALASQTNSEISMAPSPPFALNGIVLLPNGQPAARAELVLQLTNDLLHLDIEKRIITENGGNMANRPDDGARFNSAFAISDATGHFHLALMENAVALLAIHDQGFTWMTPGELTSNVVVRLQAFGNIEGTFRFGDRPGTNEEISLGLSEPHLFLFSDRFKTVTDSRGRFAFTNLPAVRFEWVRMFHPDPPGMDPLKFNTTMPSPSDAVINGGFSVRSSSRGWVWSAEREDVLVKPGETTQAELGGTDRPVVGKVVKTGMAFDWSQAYVQLIQKGLPKFQFQAYAAHIAEDGTFRVENVGAGNYDLAINFSPDDGKTSAMLVGGMLNELKRKVMVPEMAGGRSLDALDLGSLEIPHPQAQRRISVGDPAPAIPGTNFSAQGFGGEPVNPAYDPGKYLLLDLCGNYFDSDLPFLRATHYAFIADNRLDTKSVTLGYALQNEARTDAWTDIYTGPVQTADWADAYGLLDQNHTVRQIVLIGPDGKILAKDLHGDAIQAAVANALRKK